MKLLKAIRDFSVGFVDSFGRGKEPDGSFVDSRNLIPSKIGSLETVHGYASTSLSSHIADVNLLPSGFPDVTGTGTFAITNIVSEPFCFSSEYPSAYDGRVYWVEDEDDAKHIMLDTWFNGSTSKVTSIYGGFVLLDERKTVSYHSDISITGNSTHSITVANYATHGLSSNNDFYNGWRIEIVDATLGGGEPQYAYVTDYGVSAGTATITVLEDIGTLSLTWTVWQAGDTLTLRRWFHSAANMIPDWTTPGKPWESESRVRGCGGASSDEDYFPWISQYINRKFFTDVTGGDITYQGTYVDRMECWPHTLAESGAITTDVIHDVAVDADGVKDLLTDAIYGIGWTLEYDGSTESRICLGGSITTSTQFVNFKVRLAFASMSKRVTAVNIYARRTISGVTSNWYFVRRLDIVTVPAAEQAQWAFQDIDPTLKGYYSIDGTTAGNVSAQLSEADWSAKGATYYDRTGRYEETDGDADNTLSRHIVAWQYTEGLAGRRFFGTFYDPNAGETITDFVRFTGFNSGVPSLDVVSSDRAVYEIEATTGDPGSVNGLLSDKGFLYVFKNDSIHSWYINADPETWVHDVLSNQDGLYAVKSLVRIPDGGIGFADVDNFKAIVNHRIVPLTDLWRDTYYSLSGKASIISWYDKIDGAICFTNGVDTTGMVHYRGYKAKSGIAWYKIVLPSNHYPEFVSTERDESVVFTNNHASGFQGFFKWARSTYGFGGGAIIPYLKTNNEVLDESAHVLLDKIVFTKSGNADTGTLQTRVYVDTVLSQSFTSEDKGMETLYQKMRSTSARQGRRIQVEYNYHTTGESLTSGKLRLDGIDIYGAVLIPPEKSV